MKNKIDKTVFSSEEYYILLKELSPYIRKTKTIDSEDAKYLELYKEIKQSHPLWDYENSESAKVYFKTEFFYQIDDAVYLGIYHDDDKLYIVKNYDGYYFDFVGDNLSNWVEHAYPSKARREPEKIEKFKQDCFLKFGIDPNDKYDY
jgi:hypothetical protein